MEPEPVPSAEPAVGQNPEATPASAHPGKRRSFLGRLYHDLSPKWSLLRVLTFIGIPISGLLLFNFLFFPIQVSGISMEPTYYNSQFNLVFKQAYRYSGPQRGDIVAVAYRSVLYSPGGAPRRTTNGQVVMTNEILLKRVIGLPGEDVTFQLGQLYINGKLLEEPYAVYEPYTNRFNEIRQSADWWNETKTLGTNEFWVIGDNRTMPPIFHTHPRVKREAILGKAVF